jgi:hypothetical protein
MPAKLQELIKIVSDVAATLAVLLDPLLIVILIILAIFEFLKPKFIDKYINYLGFKKVTPTLVLLVILFAALWKEREKVETVYCPLLPTSVLDHLPACQRYQAAIRSFHTVSEAWQALLDNYASVDMALRIRLKKAVDEAEIPGETGLTADHKREIERLLKLAREYLTAWDAGTADKWKEFLGRHPHDEVTALAQHELEAARREGSFGQVHRVWQALLGNFRSDNQEDRGRLNEAFGQFQPSDRAGLRQEQRQELDVVKAYLDAWGAGTVDNWKEFLGQHPEVRALTQHELDVAQQAVQLEQLRRFEQLHRAWQALQANFWLDKSEDRASLETAVDQIKPYEADLTPDQKGELSLVREFLSGWHDGTVETWRGILDRFKDGPLTRIVQARLCDLQAASPNDLKKAAAGVPHRELEKQTEAQLDAATAICSAAAQAYPDALRFRYQQARTMEIRYPQLARGLHEGLCWPSCAYPAACDNLGTILYRTADQAGAIKAFEKGATCRDPDAMLSLVTGIDSKWYMPLSTDRYRVKCELLKTAAGLLDSEERKKQAEEACQQAAQLPPATLLPGSILDLLRALPGSLRR